MTSSPSSPANDQGRFSPRTPGEIGRFASLAVLFEVLTPKPGNVHRGADFDDCSVADFAAGAVAISSPLVQLAAGELGLGEAVLQAVQQTRVWTESNTNLGTVLLLAPLAAVPGKTPLSREAVRCVLDATVLQDVAQIYEAIGVAAPGGLGRVDRHDVTRPPDADLRTVMSAAAEHDLVARQFAFDFAELFELALPRLEHALAIAPSLAESLVELHLQLMAAAPDTLIARKAGAEVAEDAARRAMQVLAAGPPGSAERAAAVGELDFWLRSDGRRRNPGATADLVAATLFAALRDGLLQPPYRLWPPLSRAVAADSATD